MGTDMYAKYEKGLHILLQRLGKDHLEYRDALVYQQRLLDNIHQAKRYGDIPSLQYERAQVIDQLNSLSMSSLNVSFNVLCESSPTIDNTSPTHVSPSPSANYGHTNNATQVAITQNFINHAPNEGAQGTFNEQVTFNRGG
jgi:hypothetical protein